jgi:hypothetical protein
VKALAGLAAGMLGSGAALGVLEEAMRAALAAAGARLLEAVLEDDDGYAGPHAKCGYGHQAGYAGRRAKTITTVLGPVRLARAWYHCRECGRGFAPRDCQLAGAGTSLSPGLTQMIARVGGKPKIVSQRYLGKAGDIAAAMDGAAVLPERTQHLAFGDVAAAWSVIERLGLAGIIDEVTGSRRPDAAASVGTYLALATLNRIVAPCSKLAFADWWATTAADRWVKVPAAALDHRRFWDAMDALPVAELVPYQLTFAHLAGASFAVLGPGREDLGPGLSLPFNLGWLAVLT